MQGLAVQAGETSPLFSSAVLASGEFFVSLARPKASREPARLAWERSYGFCAVVAGFVGELAAGEGLAAGSG
jgi:hypothetical protein